MTNKDDQHYYWNDNNDNHEEETVHCLCLGTGRFLRAVLVPAFQKAGYATTLIQTRGRSMMEYMLEHQKNSDNSDAEHAGCYEVDTVLENGSVQTDWVPVKGVFSLGLEADRKAVFEMIQDPTKMKRIACLGVGVTEAGLASPETQAVQDLYAILGALSMGVRSETVATPNSRICVINTDNVPQNGALLRSHLYKCAEQDRTNGVLMTGFLDEHVAFLSSMVDRITSERPGSKGLVPRAEPVPQKALVLLDPNGDLPPPFQTLQTSHGVWIRTASSQLDSDLACKLRIANGTHTALAHIMALQGLTMTNVLSNSDDARASLLMQYADALVATQIVPAITTGAVDATSDQAVSVYQDWRRRLTHAHFGLSTFFITQSGAAKGGLRFGPTVRDLLLNESPVTVVMAMAFCQLLRWLTPAGTGKQQQQPKKGDTIYTGWLQAADRSKVATLDSVGTSDTTVTYADQLRYDLEQGWYEFKSAGAFGISGKMAKKSAAAWLADCQIGSSVKTSDVIRGYLLDAKHGNLTDVEDCPGFEDLVQAIATLYTRVVEGDDLQTLLEEMHTKSGPYVDGFATDCRVIRESALTFPLHHRPNPIPDTSALMQLPIAVDDIAAVVASEVASVQVIDLHTHLLPPTHGPLCLWGIDELLTYHYLVAEYFMTAPASMTPEAFYERSKKEQADLIWQALFVDRSPLSEACRGVLTTLAALGLTKEVEARNLEGIRQYYQTYRAQGAKGSESFSDTIHSLAGVRYNIMTNIPFNADEAQYWRPNRTTYSSHYRSALRVDPLLSGDRATVEFCLKAGGYDATVEGARQYLRDWCDTMQPEYMMASTPHNFVLPEEDKGSLGNVVKRGVNEDSMQQPGAFAQVLQSNAAQANCDGTEDDAPSIVDEQSDYLSEVLMKVCEERDLPLALKIGAHRGVNPRLQAAGDGVVAFADAGMLGRLCARFPKVRFLATFLSRNNQHEACVLASKFRNLHIYGCWWFCNNPSIITEITQMRIEMLGTAFTAQHSDARVLDQLLYKWPHSRAVVASVLAEQVEKLCASGWKPTREEIRRDVKRLFGGSYEEFMQKSLL